MKYNWGETVKMFFEDFFKQISKNIEIGNRPNTFRNQGVWLGLEMTIIAFFHLLILSSFGAEFLPEQMKYPMVSSETEEHI